MPLPNSLPWMESVDAKMIRAHEHLETLDREITEYFSTIDMKMYLKISPHQPWPFLVMHATDYIPPIRLNTLLGDCVHNIRSALDNLICGLARTIDPQCTCKGTAFPFYQNEAEWNSKAQFDLAGVPKEAKKIIKAVQPWCDSIDPSPLLILNKLSNIDKHRQCNLAFAYGHNTAFRVHCLDGTTFVASCGTPLYLGRPIDFTIPVLASELGPNPRVEASSKLVLCLQEEGPWGDLPIGVVLQQCFDYVEKNVIWRLKRFFERAVP